MTINNRLQMERLDASLEIRKLSPKYVKNLVQILETHELWKRLMSIIPKKLERNNFTCDITLDNQHKYNSEHFRLIENASEKYKRTCTEILLEEWGTSGRIRPALGHLLYLLTKAKLFRAADYVAELLNQPKPQRPSTGPEALISVHFPETQKKDKNLEDIEKLLDEIDYPGFVMSMIRSNSNEAARNNNTPAVIPQIVISPDVDNEHMQVFNVPLVVQKEKPESEQVATDSDMIKFSSSSVSTGECNIPEITQLLHEESNLPNFDLMNRSLQESLAASSVENSEEVTDTSEMSTDRPAFSQLLSAESNIDNIASLPLTELLNNGLDSVKHNIPNLSALNNPIQADNLPNLSIFKEDNQDFIPDLDALKNSTAEAGEPPVEHVSALGLLPHSSLLNPSKSLSLNISTVPNSQNSSNSTKSRPCTSPLPNLSLNTLLPHFNYSELEIATNNFNVNPYSGANEAGRFLGSGAFGSVFLAHGLLDRPVAVKKLVLGDVEVVNVDDTVTKQFRNEVEVLSKYKHENLLSLLGYSCDGCTYCLLYEYIPGGALKERLQVTENRLHWKERLSIAMGTSRAVSYLHTAFSTALIHRDIKSANILLDSKNKPKLCDFGLIKLQPSQNTNIATKVFGTSAYMAGEAFRGDISVKLDTFSFGVVLLELLTSLPPLDENRDDLVTYVKGNCNDNSIMHLIDKEVGSWEENGTNFADELFQIARKCIEEEKTQRPSMVEVTTLLEELLNKLSE